MYSPPPKKKTDVIDVGRGGGLGGGVILYPLVSKYPTRRAMSADIELDIEALEKARRPMAEEEETKPGFGKGHRKGGARQFSKPYVDSGLLFTVLEQNQQILQDMKTYELTSKCNSPDPKGLLRFGKLW